MRGLIKTELTEFVLNYSERETRAVYGNVYLSEQIGDGTDVVFVSVCKKYGAETVRVFDNVLHIGNNVVHAGQIFVRERNTAVNGDYILAAFYKCQVFAYFVKPAERDYSYFVDSFQINFLLVKKHQMCMYHR